MSPTPSVPEAVPDSATESTLAFKTRLLVVDDEPVILETMTAILEQEGFTVRTAEDGFAALAAGAATRRGTWR